MQGDDEVGAPLVGAHESRAGTRPAPALEEELNDLRLRDLYRKLRTLSRYEGTRAQWEGRELILFCGNDYLGLSRHPLVIQAAARALQDYGVGAGASRLISGTGEPHTRLESELAQFKQKESALVFGSGYLANLGVVGALAREGDWVVMDKLSHASLIDGARLSGATLRVFPHRHYEKCEEILKNSSPGRRRLLVSDAVFSMDGDLADLNELIRLKEKYDCLLLVDDAHGLGVYGANGKGATEGAEEKIDLIVGTLSKALGVFGGFAAASRALIEHLINFSRPFIFATAPPPLLCEAALASLRLIQEDPSLRQRLWRNVDKVKEFFSPSPRPSPSEREGGISEFSPLPLGERDRVGGPIFPIMIGDEREALRISEKLLERGILIPAIRYPTVRKGKARLRLAVSAAHTEEDLEKLFEALAVITRNSEDVGADLRIRP